MRMNRHLPAALAAFLFVVGCGASQPLTLWKVSSIAGAKPDSCYVDGKNTETTIPTTSIETYAGDWEIYSGPNGKYELHVPPGEPSGVFVGDLKGANYTFQGVTTTDHLDRPDNPTLTQTTTDTEIIALSTSGDTFTGTWSHAIAKKCTGSACSPTYNADNPDCTTTDQLKGTKIAAQILHQE